MGFMSNMFWRSDENKLQFRRVLMALGIGLIYTAEGSPEAQGKIEKAFETLAGYFKDRQRIS